MQKNKKLMTKIVPILAISSMSASFAISNPALASASEVDMPHNKIIDETRTNTPGIREWSEPLEKSVSIIAPPNTIWSGFTPLNSETHQFSVVSDGSPTVSDSGSLFVGKNTLTNTSNQEQTLSTSTFSHSITNTVASATTHGFKLGYKASAKFKVPFVGETGMELNAEYNFSSTNTETNSTNYTYTAPAQNIKVPAHSSVEVVVKLDKAKQKGNVQLLTKMSGIGYYRHSSIGTPGGGAGTADSFYNIVSRASKIEKQEDVSANPDGKTINIIGFGNYEAEYGTEFSVTVTPVDKKGNYTGNQQTYHVKPEIKRN